MRSHSPQAAASPVRDGPTYFLVSRLSAWSMASAWAAAASELMICPMIGSRSEPSGLVSAPGWGASGALTLTSPASSGLMPRAAGESG